MPTTQLDVALDTPPHPPGSLTAAPTSSQVLAYLTDLHAWSSSLRAALNVIDTSALVAREPDLYTPDITLAMTLYNSIDARYQELTKVWDSGRVLDNELTEIASLLWRRLPDSLNTPSAFTLAEACSLVAALTDKLAASLSNDAIAGSGQASRLAPLRDAIGRCRRQAQALKMATARIDDIAVELEAVVASSNPDTIATTIERLDREVSGIERDLIKETSRRAGAVTLAAQISREFHELTELGAAVSQLADRCRSRITDAPRIAVPKVTALGLPPSVPTNATATPELMVKLERYNTLLERSRAGLLEAQARFQAPLQARDDLRGLLGAYKNRASRYDLAEDGPLSDMYQAAHDCLWTAPCDLGIARSLTSSYQTAVRSAVGAHSSESSVVSSVGTQVPLKEQM